MLKQLNFIMICFLLSGCDAITTHMISKSADKQEVDVAKAYIDLVRHRDFEKMAVHHGLSNDKLEELRRAQGLLQAMNYFPSEEPQGIRLLRWNTIVELFSGKSIKTTVLQFEYEFSKEWLLIDMVLGTQDGKTLVQKVNVSVVDRALVEKNAFLSDKIDLFNLAFLGVMAAVFLFVLLNFIRCIRAPIRKKWLWIPFILIGMGTATLNWTEGVVIFSPLMAVILGVQISQHAPYVPWTLSVSLPVGAIIFAIMRKRLIRRASIAR